LQVESACSYCNAPIREFKGVALDGALQVEKTVLKRKRSLMDYTFLANLQTELELPERGILSRVLQKDDHVNITLFGFSAGEVLSAHSAPTPAVLYFLEGEAEVQLGDDTVSAKPGSFVYMPPMLSHGIAAKTALRLLLVQMKIKLR
jgi:quercetin dioxygenase-like cupin family protein